MKPPVGIDQARRDGDLRAAFGRVERTGRNGLSSLSDSIAAYSRATGLSRRRSVPPVHAAFAQAAGVELSRRARPVRLSRGVLTVEVDSATHLHELTSFRGEELRQRVNEILGRPDVRRIAFKPRN
ncbi:MAG: DUF721 domain-containing protein [Planctomycetes bacterium]|nr:DUF721 domain-containing protein [Planctomycetota bacterium]